MCIILNNDIKKEKKDKQDKQDKRNKKTKKTKKDKKRTKKVLYCDVRAVSHSCNFLVRSLRNNHY